MAGCGAEVVVENMRGAACLRVARRAMIRAAHFRNVLQLRQLMSSINLRIYTNLVASSVILSCRAFLRFEDM